LSSTNLSLELMNCRPMSAQWVSTTLREGG
jgi:hypothetical protein